MIDDGDLHDMEERACGSEGLFALWVRQLVSEIRHLNHELADPNYQYSGRIHRQAILCRNAEIDQLRKELTALKATKNV